jgi:hypothetical protein
MFNFEKLEVNAGAGSFANGARTVLSARFRPSSRCATRTRLSALLQPDTKGLNS